ncbi:hypothetical protein NQ317_010356 [Molorchus minor]|uniref:Secreted protein n=1 Tax=Molorchus minor TaxID=1323400 RepID=A0ABQ9IW95_9CUCU|nr:hypothetical protein NQ317_010356 [Molorchus minor]
MAIRFGQFFTVLFWRVGQGWSIWWGVIMVKVAKPDGAASCVMWNYLMLQPKIASSAVQWRIQRRQ